MEVRGITESGDRKTMRLRFSMRSCRLAIRAAMTALRSALSGARASSASTTLGVKRSSYARAVVLSSSFSAIRVSRFSQQMFHFVLESDSRLSPAPLPAPSRTSPCMSAQWTWNHYFQAL